MAVQFPNLADIYLEGARLQETARNNAFNRYANLGANFGAGMGGIIDRLRKKEAARILDEATENKRRYLAGEVQDEAEKAKLSKLYDIPESEQYLSLAGRVRHLDGDLFKALTERGRQARAHEDEIAKLGGDPRVIKFQNVIDSLTKQRAQLEAAKANAVKNPYLIAGGNVERADAGIMAIDAQLDRLRAAQLRAMGVDAESPAQGSPETSAQDAAEGGFDTSLADDAGFSAEDKKRYLGYVNELALIYDFDKMRERVSELVQNEPSEKVRFALLGILKEARERTLKEDNTLSEMEARRLNMEKTKQEMALAVTKEARDYWGSLEKPSQDAQEALFALEDVLNGQMVSAPKDLGQAKANLRAVKRAVDAVARSGDDFGTEQAKTLANAAKGLFGLAAKDEITAEEYNAEIENAIAEVQAVVRSVNKRIEARAAGATGEKAAYGKTLLVTPSANVSLGRWARLDKPLSKSWGAGDDKNEKKPTPPPPPPPGITEEKLDAAAGGIK